MGLMLIGATAELATIGALLPFLAAIAGPEKSAALQLLQPFLQDFGISSRAQTVFALTALFALAALAAAAVRLLLLWATQRFVYGVSYELAVAVYANALYQPYAIHIARNSSETLAGMNKVQTVANGVLMPLVNAVIAMVIAAFIVIGLIAIDPLVALASGAGFVLIYSAVTAIARAQLKHNSVTIAQNETQRVKVVREGLGGIREVLLNHLQPVFVEEYERVESDLRDARTSISFHSFAPRYLVEAMGIVLIAIIAATMTQRPGGFVDAIPVLGALALGAQRLLPLVQQVYSGWAQTAGNRQSMIDLIDLLETSNEITRDTQAIKTVHFAKSIVFDNVTFVYANGRAPAVERLAFVIPKGSHVGVVGRTGSGKSTTIDLLIGLLQPTSGAIRIDGEPLTSANCAGWQRQIAHVPQFIYLADASVAENIAYGVRPDEIDSARVRRAADLAALDNVVASLPMGYETTIGERGVQLSGGQRQRLGIARALYQQASLLVFDEATSSLDHQTELDVMKAIRILKGNLTIFTIAHRASTVNDCDIIIRIEKGRIVETVANFATDGCRAVHI